MAGLNQEEGRDTTFSFSPRSPRRAASNGYHFPENFVHPAVHAVPGSTWCSQCLPRSFRIRIDPPPGLHPFPVSDRSSATPGSRAFHRVLRSNVTNSRTYSARWSRLQGGTQSRPCQQINTQDSGRIEPDSPRRLTSSPWRPGLLLPLNPAGDGERHARRASHRKTWRSEWGVRRGPTVLPRRSC